MVNLISDVAFENKTVHGNYIRGEHMTLDEDNIRRKVCHICRQPRAMDKVFKPGESGWIVICIAMVIVR